MFIIYNFKKMINLKNIQTEIDASFLYKVLAENEKDLNISNIFTQMSEIELGHAHAFMKKIIQI